MEIYPKRFIRAGLIYLVIGVVLGVAISIEPSLGARMRFVHIHINLLGFMTMMIAGVAYHVLPRFSARTVPWPEGVGYHFYLQNIGLVGMVTAHAVGGGWREGASHWVFVVSAVVAGLGLVCMFYNLFFVLIAPKVPEEDRIERITGDMKVGAVLDQFPQAMPIFMQSGFTALANPAARSTFAKVVTIDKACEKHDVDASEFIDKLNTQLLGSSAAPDSKSTSESKEGADKNPGKTIRLGETCHLDTMVGSLIQVYPATRIVFEKHYGEGCFSCPGQTFEMVEETAHMHNIDPSLVLSEINAVIAEELGKK